MSAEADSWDTWSRYQRYYFASGKDVNLDGSGLHPALWILWLTWNLDNRVRGLALIHHACSLSPTKEYERSQQDTYFLHPSCFSSKESVSECPGFGKYTQIYKSSISQPEYRLRFKKIGQDVISQQSVIPVFYRSIFIWWILDSGWVL